MIPVDACRGDKHVFDSICGERLYIHIDLDVLDPGQYGNIKCPVKAGISIEELVAIIKDLGSAERGGGDQPA